MKRIIGECGKCGGDVTVPFYWMGTVPPRPACESCGREVRVGPMLRMRERRQKVGGTS